MSTDLEVGESEVKSSIDLMTSEEFEGLWHLLAVPSHPRDKGSPMGLFYMDIDPILESRLSLRHLKDSSWSLESHHINLVGDESRPRTD